MKRTLLKSKIHRARVTDADLHYEGSVTIDSGLMEEADIVEFERVEVYNITNGNRLATYAIPGEPGKGDICLNGAAAHLAKPGDLVIIASYQTVSDKKLRKSPYEPKILLVGEDNQVKKELDV
jgi:aspartate 1-decarboxylase